MGRRELLPLCASIDANKPYCFCFQDRRRDLCRLARPRMGRSRNRHRADHRTERDSGAIRYASVDWRSRPENPIPGARQGTHPIRQAALAVNRHPIGTPDRHPKGPPFLRFERCFRPSLSFDSLGRRFRPRSRGLFADVKAQFHSSSGAMLGGLRR